MTYRLTILYHKFSLCSVDVLGTVILLCVVFMPQYNVVNPYNAGYHFTGFFRAFLDLRLFQMNFCEHLKQDMWNVSTYLKLYQVNWSGCYLDIAVGSFIQLYIEKGMWMWSGFIIWKGIFMCYKLLVLLSKMGWVLCC